MGTRRWPAGTIAYGMPYSRWVSPKSRWTSWPAACAPTSVAESAASGAWLTSVFHALSGGRTGQPARIGPFVTTKAALVQARPRQARRRWRPSPTPLSLIRVVLRRAVAVRRPSIETVCGTRPARWTVSVAFGRTPTGETRTAAPAGAAAARTARAESAALGRARTRPLPQGVDARE